MKATMHDPRRAVKLNRYHVVECAARLRDFEIDSDSFSLSEKPQGRASAKAFVNVEAEQLGSGHGGASDAA
jgi:hypothetical protein